MDKYQKEQIRSLRKEGMSYAEIARQINVSRDAVISFCRRNGLQEVKKPTSVVKTNATNVCRECGKSLIQVDGMKRRVFCSKECRVKWWKEHPEQLKHKAMYQYTCPHCGEKLYPFGKSKLEETAAKFGVDCAARMPVDAKMSEAFDKGEAETAEQAELVPVLDKIESL